MVTTGSFAGKSRRPAAVAAAALFVSNALFALGGLAGFGNRAVFGSLYLLSAVCAIPMIYALIVAIRGRGATLVLIGALLMGVAAIGHATEAVVVVLSRGVEIGTAGPAVGVAELVGLVLGMLLICGGLWRAAVAPVWPGLLFLLILPANRLLPHGLAQQSARSAIVVVVSLWLAYCLFTAERESGVEATGR